MLVMRRALEWAGWVGAPVGAPSPPFPTQPAIMPGPGGGGRWGALLACLLASPLGKAEPGEGEMNVCEALKVSRPRSVLVPREEEEVC